MSKPAPYSAVVLGSTGNVGRQIVNLLAASPAVRQVAVVNRRQTNEFKGMPKVREVVVPDMDKLAELQQKQAQGGALPGPEVKSYEYSDMKRLFNRDDHKD